MKVFTNRCEPVRTRANQRTTRDKSHNNEISATKQLATTCVKNNKLRNRVFDPTDLVPTVLKTYIPNYQKITHK